MAHKSKSKLKHGLKRMASISLAALMTAGCVDATIISASAATTSSSSILSDSDRGVIYANSRTDFRDESIYFMMVTRFYNGDESNDVQCWDGTQYNLNDPAWRGDFKGVIEKLDYIKALGFTAIWITPVVENCSGYDYHGYHAIDMSKVDPRYESNDCTYQDLIDACHAKGMKIIQDVVFNHTGNFGEKNLLPMFTKEGDLSSVDCLKQVPNSGLPSNYDSLLPGYQYDARLALMKNTDGVNHDVNNIYHHYGNFNWDDYTCQIAQIAGDCVDLNTENPIVYNYLVDTYSKYIDMGVDAFRVDTVRHISRLTFNKVFNDAFIEAGKRNGKDFYMFGEVCTRDNGNYWYRQTPSMSTPFYTWKDTKDYAWSDTDWEVNYESAIQNTKDNANNIDEQPTSQNALLDGNNYHTPDYSQFSGLNVIDFPMHWSFKTAENAFQVAKRGDMYYNDATWNVTYVDSHDYAPDGAPENKRFDQDQSTWAENLALMFTFRGIPCIYYGSEIEFKKGKPIDVGPNAPLEETGRAYYGDNIEGTVTAADFGVYGNVSGAVADTLMHPLSQHIQRLNRIRQAIPALRKGQYSTEGCSGNLSFKRRYTDDTTDSFVCVTISGNSTFSGIPNGKYVDAITGDVQNVTNGTLTATVSGKGNMKVYVLDTAKTPAPGRVIPNGVYLTDGGANQPITGVPIEIVQPTSIALDKTSVTVKEATTEKVKATVAPENATNKTVSWTTSDASVATVAGGTITGVSKGTATITAKTSNGLTATVKVTVVDNPDIIRPTGITLDKTSLSLIEGGSEKLTATVAPANATNKTVTWTSSDTSVATVDNSGNVKAVLEGTATITAQTINGYKATATVTVDPKQITAIKGVYFEKPSGWGSNINVYFFSNGQTVGKSWPGTAMTDLGDGVYGYQIESTDPDLMIVFNDGKNQTKDLEYVQNGYYNASGYVKTIEPVTKGTVIVKYVDTDGNVLGTEKLTGEVGTDYITSAKRFDGYTIETCPSNAVGTFSEGTITLTYIYKADVTPVTPLANNSALSKTTINYGDSITITGAASGGTSPYKYSFLCKHSTASSWTTLTSYGTTSTRVWKPTKSGTYSVRTKVKDSTGEEVIKDFTLTVKATSLANNSTLSKTSINYGDAITITGKASGGTSPYKYTFLCKHSSASSWTTLTSYGTTSTRVWKPTKSGTYSVRTKVKDSTGKEVVKDFTLTVKSTFANNSTLSKTSISYGDAITITGKASGGTSPYKYSFLCKHSSASSWTTLTSYGTTSTRVWQPKQSGKYTVRTKVKDSTGKEVVKDFTLTVNSASLENSSTLSKTSINFGDSITIKGKATGGTLPYKYTFLCKHSSSSSWTTLTSYGTTSTRVWQPKKSGTYTVRTKVKDSTGEEIIKDFTLTVK